MEAIRQDEKIPLEHLLVRKDQGIATITINRPEVLNALARRTKREIKLTVEAMAGDGDVRLIVMTGAGDRAFSVGTDVREMKDFSVLDAEQMLRTEHGMYDAIRRCPKPVIAAVNGHALGGGCVLAICCDFTVAAETAQLGLSEIKVGVPVPIEGALLPRLVGIGRTRELVLLGESVSAKEAERIGLINRVVPPAQLQDAVREVANKLLRLSPTALRVQKELLNKWLETDLTSVIVSSIYAASLCFATPEPSQAINAFLERKRGKPHA